MPLWKAECTLRLTKLSKSGSCRLEVALRVHPGMPLSSFDKKSDGKSRHYFKPQADRWNDKIDAANTVIVRDSNDHVTSATVGYREFAYWNSMSE